jgi:hypothetical protein
MFNLGFDAEAEPEPEPFFGKDGFEHDDLVLGVLVKPTNKVRVSCSVRDGRKTE